MGKQELGLPTDTIAAISTAPGRAGLSVVRVSGPEAVLVAASLGVTGLTPRRCVLTAVHHPDDGRLIDQAIVTLYRSPASYTGEDVLEISGHGGALAPQLLLDAACAAGARPAGPGEFTRRAFLNGKIDLLQVEATLDLIDARSEVAHRTALFQLERGLSRKIAQLREGLLRLQAMLTYEIDFPEEDDGPVPERRIQGAARWLIERLEALLLHAPEGELVRDGALTVIAGRPNAGKSSLFNSLLGEERAIVTEVPGTTRDAIEALLTVEGYPFRLVDTAGLCRSVDRVESLGIEVAESYLARADLVLFCAEAGRALDEEERTFLRRWSPVSDGRPSVVLVRTKVDRSGGWDEELLEEPSLEDPSVEVTVSAVRGDGLQALRQLLLQAAYSGIRADADTPLVTRKRQARAIQRALRDSEAFMNARDAGLPPEIAATHLLDAERALEELLGVVETDDVLDVVFSSFCIGK